MVINAPEQATPEWLTGVLRESASLGRATVISVRNKLTKMLVLSIVSRLEVDYSADAPASLPSNLFLKISRPDLPPSVYSEFNNQEVEFYLTVAPTMDDPPFIRCYDAAYSEESGKSHLLLDDLSETHFQPEPPLLPSRACRELAADCMAELHAYWWEHPRLGKGIGKLFDEVWLTSFLREVEKNVHGFMNFLGDGLSAERRKIYERLLASKYQIWGRLTEAKGLTVTHGDAHWWNFLYPRDADSERVRLFDWHLWHVDLGARDMAFMIGLGGDLEQRAEEELHLVRRYHEGLTGHGVVNYSWEDCWDDYRRSSLRNLNVPVVQWSQGRSESVWSVNLERAMIAYEELGCSELLRE